MMADALGVDMDDIVMGKLAKTKSKYSSKPSVTTSRNTSTGI